MRTRWLPDSARDLEDIKNYLLQHQPDLAQRSVLRIYEAIKSLKRSPHRGRPGAKPGTRELVLTPLPYIAVYRVKDDTIEILRIWHGAQNRQ